MKDNFQEHNLVGQNVWAGEISHLRSVLRQWQTETGDTEPAHLTPDWNVRETTTQERLPVWGTRGEMTGAAVRADTINAKGPF